MSSELVSIPGVEIIAELGRGAHSIVYRALREGRPYAVKIPLGNEGDRGELSRRFLREAVSLARLKHPALPAVLEVGQVGGAPYLIMELVSGETLAQYLRRGPLNEEQTLELGKQLASALIRIHDGGLVHRDVKPENILFDAQTTAIRLIDFGLVGPTSATADLTAAHFPAHSFSPAFGTEQQDLHALGAVLFECIAGISLSSVADPASLLSRRAELGARPNGDASISPALAGILRRLLGLERTPGYPDASSLLHDLERAVEHPDGADVARPRRRLAGSTRGSSIPLIGRERDVDRLRSAWRTSAAGQGQVVFVRGSAGSGKTRLVQSLVDQVLAEGRGALIVTCGSTEPQPFAAVRDLIEAHLSELALGPGGTARADADFSDLAGDLAPLLKVLSPRLTRLFRDVRTLARADGAEHMMVESLAEFLSRMLAARGPGILVVDDVQWLDAGSRRVLSRLADRVRSLSTLYVFVGRDDARSAGPVSALLRRLRSEQINEIALGSLEEPRVGELIRAYLGDSALPNELLRHVGRLSDGTPLSVTETLRAMLELGVLTPHWGQWRFDSEAARRMDLPRGAQELLARRISELSTATIDVLATAAVIGTVFEGALLTRACQVDGKHLEEALADSRRALLVETNDQDRHRFVHDSVREALLARLSQQSAEELHQRIAESLDALHDNLELRVSSVGDLASALWGADGAEPERKTSGPDFDATDATQVALVYQLATHYAEGVLARRPKRRFDICVSAGKLAFRSFDNELSLRFFESARSAARHMSGEFGLELELLVGEAQARLGAFDGGLASFRRVVERGAEPTTRALALSRIAWIEMQIDTDKSWIAVEQAFTVMGARSPRDSIWGLLGALLPWLRRSLLPTRPLASAEERRRVEVLCALYYQSARLASYTVSPLRLLQAVLRGIGPAERLGRSSALSNGYLMYGFVLVVLGLRRAGMRYLRAAESIAMETGDPIVFAHTLQVGSAVLAWSGDIQKSLEFGARSLEEYGHWRELTEFCLTAYNQQLIEVVRGRVLEGWKWLDRAMTKLANHEGPPMALEFVEHSVRATLCALGREHDATILLSRLADVTVPAAERGAYMLPNYAWRVRMFTECGKLGDEFEAIVAEVRAQNFDPRRVHLAVIEYYVHVAHARVHACLRCKRSELPAHLERLKSACSDLKRGARIPMLTAHALVIEAYVAWFSDDAKRAQTLFGEAERLARSQVLPWVLYAVHRGQAHMLLAVGNTEGARDEARVAEALAREHGAAYRLRWVREEFQLRGRTAQGASASPGSPVSAHPPSPSISSAEGENTRPRRYLKALVRLGQNNVKELDLEQLGRAVLTELIGMFRAERGFLFLTADRVREHTTPQPGESGSESPEETSAPSSGSARDELALLAARNANGDDLVPDANWDLKLIEELFLFAGADSERDSTPVAPGSVTFFGDRAVIATPLFVGGKAIGVAYLDRPLNVGVFDESDARALGTIAQQVPLVIELAKSLRVRELAKETEQSAERLDAIARLAGGIAHDFNNMLSVIFAASEHLGEEHARASVAADVSTIQSAAERARDLTRQLLAFSRGQYLRPELIDLNELVRHLEPIFRRLLGHSELELELDSTLCRVKADPAQIDQVLTNLVVNAADAMPRAGRLRIATSNVAAHGQPPRRHAQIVISDTGEGMSETTISRVFEPFFTTKGPSGNGLGLATAHGIVKQSGGQIELESQLGVGTTFRISLPEARGELSTPPPPLDAPTQRNGAAATILLVDDEPMVREAIRRILASRGYRVVSVPSGDEALRFAADRSEAIDLLITDVIMPKMNGLELARELDKVRPDVKVLFVSGHTRGVFAERGVLKESVEFLPKPISMDSLTQRVDALLRH
ncbi:MAG TPA: response regulator [Polyangiaceae bacterium]|jgi:signal transduction histidine kinase/CheY-like chemotaxis protein/tRNA A-37 threonylcarbamoyl transferase component Bud32